MSFYKFKIGSFLLTIQNFNNTLMTIVLKAVFGVYKTTLKTPIAPCILHIIDCAKLGSKKQLSIYNKGRWYIFQRPLSIF